MPDIYKGGKLLPVLEEFYTVQGEGYHTGKAAYFIRVGGCDIGCRWCDTKFSWRADVHKLTSVDEVVERALQTEGRAVVVTGGEPTTYNLNYLCENLKKYHIQTFIETSGAYPLSGKWDWICLSPKKQTPPLPEFFPLANELKVIIQKKEDLEWAVHNSLKVSNLCKLFLQPEWSNYEKIVPDIVDFVKRNPRWQISIQAHKFMHIP